MSREGRGLGSLVEELLKTFPSPPPSQLPTKPNYQPTTYSLDATTKSIPSLSHHMLLAWTLSSSESLLWARMRGTRKGCREEGEDRSERIVGWTGTGWDKEWMVYVEWVGWVKELCQTTQHRHSQPSYPFPPHTRPIHHPPAEGSIIW